MPENSIQERVLDTLVGAGLLTADQVASVRDAASDGTPVSAILIERGLVTADDVGTALEDELGIPRVDLSSYAPDDDALALIHANVARSRKVLPLFDIDGTLTVAVGDPMDVLELDSLAREIGVEVDPVLTDPVSLLGAIVQYYGDQAAQGAVAPVAPVVEEEAASHEPERVPEEQRPSMSPAAVEDLAGQAAGALAGEAPAEPPVSLEEIAATAVPTGAHAVDLDVLAVADSTKVALLVADIVEDAASKGASRVHLLPYKDDFFLVYRLKGRLEKVGSAPLSMQGALVEGFRNFARVGAGPAGAPALGRVRGHFGGQDLVLTIAIVPTIAGQRVVISLAPFRPDPPDLAKLGMSEAEVRAMHAMVERGRGILLVAAPVAEGRSATYYALLHHAASAGKTVYSVERGIEYEIPAVAQVLVSPSSPVGAAAYLGMGRRQDTDVIGIDGLESVEEIHLAAEAAGAGRLVIATFAAADIVSGVRRMLDMGAEPHSLAAALTLAVGQRLVRTNCSSCSQERASKVAASIPGAPKDLVNRGGSGCPNCNQTGFTGLTGIFEVLPFSDPVRAAVARSLPAADLAAAARAAGMRPLVASGLARVTAGSVSAEELDRVLHFSG